MNILELEKIGKRWETKRSAGCWNGDNNTRTQTFRETETEVDERLAAIRARMLSDAAMSSKATEWERSENIPVCPECGTKLGKKGKRKRHKKTHGGAGN